MAVLHRIVEGLKISILIYERERKSSACATFTIMDVWSMCVFPNFLCVAPLPKKPKKETGQLIVVLFLNDYDVS
jgi:hypothetical protein